MKYIIFEEMNGPCSMKIDEPIIIFPDMIDHEEIAKKIGSNVKSSGFVNMDDQVCYGRSSSLNVSSKPEDTNILKKYLKLSKINERFAM